MTVLRSYQSQTAKLVIANRLDIVLIDKQQKKVVVINVGTLSNSKHQEEETCEARNIAKAEIGAR